MTVVSLLISVALAEGPAFDAPRAASAAISARPDAKVAIACARFDAAAGPLALLGAKNPLRRVFEGDAAAAGVDVAAPVTVTYGEGAATLRIGFSGTEAQADALVRAVDPTATGAAGRWQFADTVVALGAGELAFSRASAADAAARPFEVPALPSAPGCGIAARTTSKDKKSVEIASLVPFVGSGPSVTWLDFEAPVPAVLARTDAELPVGMLPDAPDAVITLAAPLDELLAAMPSTADKDGTLSALRAHARLPAGLTMVTLGNPKKGGTIAAMSRVVDTDGDAFPRNRLVKAVAAQLEDKGGVRLDKATIEVTDKKGQVNYLAFAKDGRVLFTNSLPLTATAFGDEGVSWLSPEAEARARTATLAFAVSGKAQPGAMWLTAKAVEGDVRVDAQLELPAAQREAFLAMGAMFLPMVEGMVKLGMEKAKAVAPDAAPAP